MDASAAALAAGAAENEVLALLQSAPAKAGAAELVTTLGDFKDLLSEGLLDREARQVALKGLELRLKAPQAKASKPVDAREALRLKREASAREAEAARRDEVRERAGRKGQDGALAQPTPAPN